MFKPERFKIWEHGPVYEPKFGEVFQRPSSPVAQIVLFHFISPVHTVLLVSPSSCNKRENLFTATTWKALFVSSNERIPKNQQ